MKTSVKAILKRSWICHDRDNGITSIIRFVSKRNDGNYIIAVARGIMSDTEAVYSPGYGKKSARDKMHRYMKSYNFTKSTRKTAYVVKAEEYKGRDDNARYDHHTIFFVGGESLMTTKEMELWHSKALPALERVLE